MPDLRQRSVLPEKMDNPAVPADEVQLALREIARINQLLGGYSLIFHALDMIAWPEAETTTIMDIGCGGGDLLRALSVWARKRGRRVQLTGVDINPIMTLYAGNQSLKYQDITFRTANVFDEALQAEASHIVMCSLFTHHFDGDALVQLIQRMSKLASRAVIINDLHRHWIAYHSIRLLTLLFSRSYLVKHDAPLSVARSLSRREWREVMSAAGILNYSIRWRWAWRWEIIIRK